MYQWVGGGANLIRCSRGCGLSSTPPPAADAGNGPAPRSPRPDNHVRSKASQRGGSVGAASSSRHYKTRDSSRRGPTQWGMRVWHCVAVRRTPALRGLSGPWAVRAGLGGAGQTLRLPALSDFLDSIFTAGGWLCVEGEGLKKGPALPRSPERARQGAGQRRRVIGRPGLSAERGAMRRRVSKRASENVRLPVTLLDSTTLWQARLTLTAPSRDTRGGWCSTVRSVR